MTRGLSAGEISALATANYVTEEHLKITTRNYSIAGTAVTYSTLQTLRYTTGPADTVVGGDGTYVAASYVSDFSFAEERYEVAPQTVNIMFETLTSTLITALDINTKYSTLIEIYKVYKDTSTGSITARFLMFSGNLVGLEISGNKQTQTVALRCSNNFSQFNNTNGRTLARLSQPPSGQTIFWGNIRI